MLIPDQTIRTYKGDFRFMLIRSNTVVTHGAASGSSSTMEAVFKCLAQRLLFSFCGCTYIELQLGQLGYHPCLVPAILYDPCKRKCKIGPARARLVSRARLAGGYLAETLTRGAAQCNEVL